MSTEFNNSPSHYFRGKTVFVTGATGLVGKLIIEKLLRLEAQKIFILIRHKKGVGAAARVDILLDEVVFRGHDKVRHGQVIAVEGDLSAPLLGISENDANVLVEETQLVFHAAARVSFDDNFQEAVQINVLGTQEVVALAEKMLNLEAFLYVSTAFANCTQNWVKEQLYPPPMEPAAFLRAIDMMCEDELLALSGAVTKPWPNSYTYTKALAESLVARSKLPFAIVRPSIILTTYTEPIPGYTNNIYGLNGVIVGVATGILRIMYMPDSPVDCVPADYVINCTLLAAWKRAHDTTATVFHCVSTNDKALRCQFVRDRASLYADIMPPLQCLWRIKMQYTNSPTMARVLEVFYHLIPAIFFDLLLRIRQQPAMIMRIYRKIATFNGAIAMIFSSQKPKTNDRMMALFDSLSDAEQKTFFCDVRTIDWCDFFENYLAGMRAHITNESPETIPAALRQQRKFKLLHYTILIVLYSLIGVFAYKFLLPNNLKWIFY